MCPPVEDMSSISMDIGCAAHFNNTVLRNLENLALKCHPLVEDATCEWKYNNIVLGNSKTCAVSTHDTHIFIVYPSIRALVIRVGEKRYYLPVDTLITCTCYSPTIDKIESRSTRITSPDFLDGRK